MFKGRKISGKGLIIGLGSVLVVVFLGFFIFSVVFVKSAFEHRVEKFSYTPEALGLTAETVELTSSDGIDLKGWWIPKEKSRGIVVLLHGMDGLDASTLLPQAVFLQEAGYAVFVLDMRAHGRSGGNRIGLAFEEPRDVEAVLDWIINQPTLAEKPVVLLGLSMGGATAIRTAAFRTEVDAVISVSAFASIDKMISGGMRMMDFPEAGIKIFEPFSKLGMLTVYGAWPAKASPLRDIPRISPRPVLILHGTADSQIPVENGYWLKEAGGENVILSIIEGADHLIFSEDGLSDTPEDVLYRQYILSFLDTVMNPIDH